MPVPVLSLRGLLSIFGSAVFGIAVSTSAQAAGDRALGEYLSSECATCHQTSGRQQGGIPAIIGFPEDQFIALMGAYKNGQRDNQVMATIAGRLAQDEIAALASYYGSLKPAN
jgi:cytochrome c553